jgi:alcohol dehydrogenase class IV
MMATGLVQRATDGLRAAGVAVTLFDQVQADPPESIVLQAAEQARGATGVIGFGGGSSLDVAKARRAFGRVRSTTGASLRYWQCAGAAPAAGIGADHSGDWLRGDANFNCNLQVHRRKWAW